MRSPFPDVRADIFLSRHISEHLPNFSKDCFCHFFTFLCMWFFFFFKKWVSDSIFSGPFLSHDKKYLRPLKYPISNEPLFIFPSIHLVMCCHSSLYLHQTVFAPAQLQCQTSWPAWSEVSVCHKLVRAHPLFSSNHGQFQLQWQLQKCNQMYVKYSMPFKVHLQTFIMNLKASIKTSLPLERAYQNE